MFRIYDVTRLYEGLGLVMASYSKGSCYLYLENYLFSIRWSKLYHYLEDSSNQTLDTKILCFGSTVG